MISGRQQPAKPSVIIADHSLQHGFVRNSDWMSERYSQEMFLIVISHLEYSGAQDHEPSVLFLTTFCSWVTIPLTSSKQCITSGL
jgi:hypothetical protein